MAIQPMAINIDKYLDSVYNNVTFEVNNIRASHWKLIKVMVNGAEIPFEVINYDKPPRFRMSRANFPEDVKEFVVTFRQREDVFPRGYELETTEHVLQWSDHEELTRNGEQIIVQGYKSKTNRVMLRPIE